MISSKGTLEFDGQRRLGGPSHTTEFSYLVESERSEGRRLRREITYRILDAAGM